MVKAGEIRSLTGIRGFAALFVVAYHLFTQDGAAGAMLTHGYNAVDLFFVLSGFVMALTYGHTFTGPFSVSDFRAFLLKRLCRIYPLFAVVTLATFVIFQLQIGTTHPRLERPAYTLALNLLCLQGWGFAYNIVGPGWSISTEWAAYLAFPVLMIAAMRSRAAAIMLTAAALLGLAALAGGPDRLIVGSAPRNGPLDVGGGSGNPFGLVRCLCGFSLGLVAFRWRKRFKAWLATPVFVGLLALLAIPGTDLLILAACVVLVAALAHDRGIVARVLASRPVYTLGVWSYSIYLLQTRVNVVQRIAQGRLERVGIDHARLLAGLISMAVLVLCSALSYVLIEKPARVWLRRVLDLRAGSPMRLEPAAP